MSELYSLHQITHSGGGECFAAVADALPGLSRRKARLAVMAGLVQVDGRLIQQAREELPEGEISLRIDLRHGIPDRTAQKRARVSGHDPRPSRPFSILHHDADVVVVDKLRVF